MLENHTDFLADIIDIFICDELTTVIDFAGSWFFEAVNQTEEGRLSASGRTENDDAFAFFKFEINSVDYAVFAKRFFEIFN